MSDGEYKYIICEVFYAPRENSRHKIRAKPLPGQWAGQTFRIECPLEIRNLQTVGELYKFKAKFKDTLTATQLYTSYHWFPKRVTQEQANAFIEARNWEVE